MKLIPVKELFTVKRGGQIPFYQLIPDDSADSVPYVSSTIFTNGVLERVKPDSRLKLFPAGAITVTVGSGDKTAAFLQPEPFYVSRDCIILIPKIELSNAEKLFYCACIKYSGFRYSYWRKPVRDFTCNKIALPDIKAVPDWVK